VFVDLTSPWEMPVSSAASIASRCMAMRVGVARTRALGAVCPAGPSVECLLRSPSEQVVAPESGIRRRDPVEGTR
jgi:hypothetical protein